MPEPHSPDTQHPPEIPAATKLSPQRGKDASWQELKERYLGQMQAAGFSSIPEPDSRDFPAFLAKLNAKHPALAREFVGETRRLRREMDLPSSSASRRRERSRHTRRMMLMRRMPDGRWVLDKQKAPVYGMLGLLVLGGLLTAVYALPQLNGTSAFASAASPTTAPPDAPVSPAPSAADPASQAALERSREQLRQFRAKSTATPAIKAPDTTSSPTSRPKSLVAVKNPPPPPKIVKTPAASPAVFQPVKETSGSSSGFQPQPNTVNTASSSIPPQNLTYAPPPSTPEVLPFGGDATAATPVARSEPMPSKAVEVPASIPPAAAVSTVRPVSVTPLSTEPNMVLPVETPQAAPSTDPGVAAPVPTASTPVIAPPAVPFGGNFTPPPIDASGTADAGEGQSSANPALYVTSTSARFVRGMVYERKPPTASPASATVPPTDPALSPPSTGAETPFGSNAANPPSKIGATGPFKPLQQIPAVLLTGLRAPNGGSVPVVATTPDGGSFVGVATVNATLARVDILFRRYISPDGIIHQIDALAYARDGSGLTQGIPATVEAFAPTLALDVAQNSANALNTYVQNAAAAATKAVSGTTINLGDGNTLSGPSAASLAQTLLGGIGATFKMPENSQSIIRVASVKSNATMIVIAGLGGGQ